MTTSLPTMDDVLNVIPEYPRHITIQAIAEALRKNGGWDSALKTRIRRRLQVATKLGIVAAKMSAFGYYSYWKPKDMSSNTPQQNKEPKPMTTTARHDIQVDLLKFVEYMVAKHKATNGTTWRAEFEVEIKRVLIFALNFEEDLQFSKEQVHKLFALWQGAK